MSIKLDLNDPRLSLPNSVKTRDGFVFDPNTDCWQIPSDGSKSASFNFSDLHCEAALLAALKNVLIDYLECDCPASLHGFYVEFKRFVKAQTISTSPQLSYISEIDLMNYRGKTTEHELTKLRTLLRRWDKLDIPGITPEAVNYLKKLKLKANPNIGANVLTNDPNNGPFDHLELGSLVTALDYAYGKGVISVRGIILLKLFIGYGARSKSFAALKVKDFIIKEDNGMVRFFLNIPKSKQHLSIRETFDKRPMHPNLGVLLKTWEKILLQEYEEKIHDGIDMG